MLDMVPNHSAVDAVWTTSHPEFYVQKPSSGSFNPANFVNWAGHSYAFGADPYDAPWTDTCQVACPVQPEMTPTPTRDVYLVTAFTFL